MSVSIMNWPSMCQRQEFIMLMDVGVQLSVFHINWKEQLSNPLLQTVTNPAE